MDLAARLDAGLAALQLSLTPQQCRQLLDYLALLQKWNATYNLTAIRAPEDMLVQHVLDALAILSPVRESTPAARQAGFRLADVGSGAGLPGIPLAVAVPDWIITSVEASGKKAAFQRQAAIELGLGNVAVVSARAESLPAGSADAAISRAFADLPRFVAVAGQLAPVLLAMKGVLPAAEIASLPAGWRVAATPPVQVPGLEAQRHLIVLEKP